MREKQMTFYVHPNALCETSQVGENTRVWAFSHVLPGATIGTDCNICDGVFIENDVKVGNRVTIKCGVQLWDGLTIEDDVFIGPNVTFTNDRHPRSKCYPDAFEKTRVCQGASIGANATILPGLVIGKFAMVGAGAVVTHTVPPYAVVTGNPARITGYVNAQPDVSQAASLGESITTSKVRGVTLHRFNHVQDLRGDLTVGEFERDIPFIPKRYFLVFDVPSGKTRGQHAHKLCQQFLICVKGQCAVVADDGYERQEFLLNTPSLGLYLPAMTWGTQYKYSPDAVLLVFASDHYDSDDYIRDYDEFISCRLSLGPT
jgi:UDP-2-acetamido-3-amino-2,3-dideoxy-glucuronate N-acetyltransferase